MIHSCASDEAFGYLKRVIVTPAVYPALDEVRVPTDRDRVSPTSLRAKRARRRPPGERSERRAIARPRRAKRAPRDSAAHGRRPRAITTRHPPGPILVWSVPGERPTGSRQTLAPWQIFTLTCPARTGITGGPAKGPARLTQLFWSCLGERRGNGPTILTLHRRS